MAIDDIFLQDRIPNQTNIPVTIAQNNKRTLETIANTRGGKVNGKIDPRVAAAKERARVAAEKAKQTNISMQTEIKSDLEEVTAEEYVTEAKRHPMQEMLDAPIQPTNLIVGAGEQLKLGKVAEQALKMLGTGLKPSIVASALAVSPAYISQLMADVDFANAVRERKVETLTKANEHDDNLHEVEVEALKKLRTAMQFTNKPGELARIFSIVNNAKRRGITNEDGMPEEGKTVVTLTLPSAARSRINLQVELNEQNQVISAGNQRLGAIDPKSLLESLS